MAPSEQRQSLEEAFDRIEETILPSITMMLDTLIDAAALARPGADGEAFAAELRTLALQLEELTREIEAISPARLSAHQYSVASVA